MSKKLNETSKLKDIEDSYFVRMMLPDAEKKAELYVKEERNALLQLISSTDKINKKNFVVIGAGTLWYLELVFEKVKMYIAVEPLADTFVQKQVNFILSKHNNIKVIGKELGKFKEDEIPNDNSIFVFHFNILAYIPNPIIKINKYLKKGDILYFSTWNTSDKAKQIRKKYFDYISFNQSANSFKIDQEKPTALCDLNNFPFTKLKYYKMHKRIKGNITDILIIYC